MGCLALAIWFQKENQINNHTKLKKLKKPPCVAANQTLVFNSSSAGKGEEVCNSSRHLSSSTCGGQLPGSMAAVALALKHALELLVEANVARHSRNLHKRQGQGTIRA